MSDTRRDELVDELRSMLDCVSDVMEWDNDGNKLPPNALFIEGQMDAGKMARVGAILTELSTLWPRATPDASAPLA